MENAIKNNFSKTSFAERTADLIAQEHSWQQYNSEAKFHSKNMLKSLEELAAQTFPTDTFNSNAYQEAIVESLTKTISPEIGVKDFWKAMTEANCKTLSIENGHLKFFTIDKTKIDITPYTQPIVFEARSSFYRLREAERENRILEAKKQLQELIQEIHRH